MTKRLPVTRPLTPKTKYGSPWPLSCWSSHMLCCFIKCRLSMDNFFSHSNWTWPFMVDLPIKHGDFLYSYAGYASLRSFTAPRVPQSERCAVFFLGSPPQVSRSSAATAFASQPSGPVCSPHFMATYGNKQPETVVNGGEWWWMVVNGGDYWLTPSNVDVETSMKIHPKSCKTIGEFVATMFLDLELLARQTHKFT